MLKNKISVISLILVNLYPIYGVLFLNWSLAEIFMIYLIENLIVVFFCGLKIFFTKPHNYQNLSPFIFILQKIGIILALFIAGLTLNGFYYLFLNSFFFKNRLFELISFVSVLGIFISHGISFLVNYLGKKEYLGATDEGLISIFLKRVAPLYFTILFGGFLMVNIDGSYNLFSTIFFILFKIVSDVISHVQEHGQIVIKKKAGFSKGKPSLSTYKSNPSK